MEVSWCDTILLADGQYWYKEQLSSLPPMVLNGLEFGLKTKKKSVSVWSEKQSSPKMECKLSLSFSSVGLS